MSKRKFTPEQIEQLKANPYVKHVSDKGITYTEEFKEFFHLKYSDGTGPTEIFRQAGFDPKVLGRDRIDSFRDRIRKYAEREDGFKDRRKDSSGRPRTKDLTLEEQLERLQEQNRILKQENIFLKRVRLLNKQLILKQSKD